MIDLLVSMVVIAVLIAIMVPSLSTVRESARRVICASNVRQIGLGVAMYSDDYDGALPQSKFTAVSEDGPGEPHQMMFVRIDGHDYWDGIGRLFPSGYLDAPGVYYCPSHRGNHPFKRYASRWAEEPGEVVGNYQLRSFKGLSFATAQGQAMLTDGLRSQADYNHRIGSNVLRTDMTVSWFADPGGRFAAQLPRTEDDQSAAAAVTDAWRSLDESLQQSRTPR